jgi:hypothetical protein
MRVAIWAAVSKPEQARKDKVSIKLQVQKGREFITSRQFTKAGEYVVPGESRTKYISLYQAEKEIPELHQLLEAASRREFDILFVYDLNRFRTLMRQIFDVLCDYNIQIFVNTYPREPVPPHEYTEEVKSAVGMIVDLSNIISRSEISNLQRHFREKMPARIQRGLDARLGGTPFGYKRIHPGDKKNPLIQDPPKARVVKRIKDLYLKGGSFKGICKILNDEKIPASEGGIWYPESIKLILSSPFYAGIVYFGITKYTRDRRTGKEKVSRNPNPVYGKGKHIPLWDEATHHRILEIIEKRGRGSRGVKTARLSRLLYCECGKVLHLDRRAKDDFPYWRCSAKKRGHTFITDSKANTIVFPAIVKAIQEAPRIPIPKEKKVEPIKDLHFEIQDLEKKKKRWMDMYETSEIDAPTLSERIREINTRIDTSRSLLAKSEATIYRRSASHATFLRLAQLLDGLQGYYSSAPAPQVNADLHAIIKKVAITKKHEISIHWRVGDD